MTHLLTRLIRGSYSFVDQINKPTVVCIVAIGETKGWPCLCCCNALTRVCEEPLKDMVLNGLGIRETWPLKMPPS